MAGKSASTSAARINQLAIQTSALGLAISRGWGTGRLKCNLIWFGGFRSIAKTEKSGGKGGGVKSTTYTYSASLIMSLCDGPIIGVRSVYRDKDVFTDGATTALAQAGLSLASGEIGQAPWPYLVSMFPDQALGYSGTAYVYGQDYSLTDSASLQNHSFEVEFASRIPGLPDADPAVIVREAIEGTPGWPDGMIASLGVYSTYCLASNLVLSPVIEQQQTVSDFVDEILMATNSESVWSEGQVKIIPYGDTTVSANGRTYVPDLTPVYDLTEEDFIPQGGEGGPPVSQDIVDQTDAYNIVQVEHLDRSNQYNTAIQTAQDLDNIIEYEPRKRDPITLRAICVPEIGQHAAQLILQRGLYRREQFKFQLPWSFILLEPMDYVTLTTTTDRLQLNRRLVQIKEIDEDEDGMLSFLAEGVESGTAAAPRYSAHASEGYAVNTSVTPPFVADPVLINAPLSLTAGAPEVWIAASSPEAHWGGCEVWVSADGTNYKQVGVIQDPARYGPATSTLPALPDPDTTSQLGVSIALSGGKIETASQEDVDAGETLFWLDGELMAYRDAVLTGPQEYDLGYLRRGLYGSVPQDHVTGEIFVRLDDAIFRYSYADLGVGSEIYVKLPSFNEFGMAVQSLADVEAMTLSLEPVPAGVTNLRVVSISQAGDILISWSPVQGSTSYDVFVYSPDGEVFKRTASVTTEQFTYAQSDQEADGDLPGFKFFVVANNAAGSGPPATVIAGTGTGGSGGGTPGSPQPAAVTGPRAGGGRNTLTIACDPSADLATTGYAFYASTVSGFIPTDADLVGTSATNTLRVGIYADVWYVRIAAFNNSWDQHVTLLNMSAQAGPVIVQDYAENCLDPETMVETSEGYLRLGELEAGMVVRTTHAETGRAGLYTVMAAETHHALERITVSLEDGRTLTGTPRHRVMTIDQSWSRLEDLEPGDVLAGATPGVVSSSSPGGAGPVVRVTVSGAQTYMSSGILSHNIKQ